MNYVLILPMFGLLTLGSGRSVSYHQKCLVNIRDYWKQEGMMGEPRYRAETGLHESPFELASYNSVDFHKISPENTILWYLRSTDRRRTIQKFIVYAEETISPLEASRCGLGFLTPDIETSQLADDSCRSSILESFSQDLGFVPFAWTSPRCGCIYLRADVVDDRGQYFTFEHDRQQRLQKLLCVDSAASATESASAFDLVNVYSKMWYSDLTSPALAEDISIEVISDPPDPGLVAPEDTDMALDDPEILEFIRTLKKALEEMHANDSVLRDSPGVTSERVPPHDLQVYLLEPKTTTANYVPETSRASLALTESHRYLEAQPPGDVTPDLIMTFPSDVGVVIQDTDGQGYLLLEGSSVHAPKQKVVKQVSLISSASAEITVKEEVDPEDDVGEGEEDPLYRDSDLPAPEDYPSSDSPTPTPTIVTSVTVRDLCSTEDCLEEDHLLQRVMLEERKPYLKIKAEKHLQGQITCCEQGLNFALSEVKREGSFLEGEICKSVPEDMVRNANTVFGVATVICKTKYLLCCYAAQPQNARSSDPLR